MDSLEHMKTFSILFYLSEHTMSRHRWIAATKGGKNNLITVLINSMSLSMVLNLVCRLTPHSSSSHYISVYRFRRTRADAPSPYCARTCIHIVILCLRDWRKLTQTAGGWRLIVGNCRAAHEKRNERTGKLDDGAAARLIKADEWWAEDATAACSSPPLFSSVLFQFGVSDPGSGVDYRWDPPGGGERVFCQLPALRLHADAAGRNVCTTATRHSETTSPQ